MSTEVHKRRGPHQGNFTCPLCCRCPREFGIILQFLPHAFICCPLLTHALPFSRSLSWPNVTDIFLDLVNKPLSLPPSRQGSPRIAFLRAPLSPDFQWPPDSRVSRSSSEVRRTYHVAARPSYPPSRHELGEGGPGLQGGPKAQGGGTQPGV